MNRRAATQANDRLTARLSLACISADHGSSPEPAAARLAAQPVFYQGRVVELLLGNAYNRAVGLYAPLTTNSQRADLLLLIAGGPRVEGAERVQVGAKIGRGIAERDAPLAVRRAAIGLPLDAAIDHDGVVARADHLDRILDQRVPARSSATRLVMP